MIFWISFGFRRLGRNSIFTHAVRKFAFRVNEVEAKNAIGRAKKMWQKG